MDGKPQLWARGRASNTRDVKIVNMPTADAGTIAWLPKRVSDNQLPRAHIHVSLDYDCISILCILYQSPK